MKRETNVSQIISLQCTPNISMIQITRGDRKYHVVVKINENKAQGNQDPVTIGQSAG